jgi:aspartate aminotransferase-like enzyme
MLSHPVFGKKRIFAPGPTPVPEEVRALLGQSPLHHRTPEFAEILQRVWKNLAFLCQTENPVHVLSASGTGAMEAALTNTLCSGDEVLVINAGKFGERWKQMAEAYRLRVSEYALPWGTAADPTHLGELLAERPNTRAVLVQASETSTGVLHPIRELSQAVKRKSAHALFFVDAITALGVCPMPMDEWGIDALVSGSQKALMLPPGISTLAFSQAALAASQKANLPRFYFNLKTEEKFRPSGQTAWTPAVGLIVALDLVLEKMRLCGLEAVYDHHERLAEGTRQGLQALGLELLAKSHPAPSLTAWLFPERAPLADKLIEWVRRRFGITLAEGQDAYKGKLVRLAHLGYFDELDMLSVLSAIEMALVALDVPVQLGYGVAAASKYFLEREALCPKA